MKGIELLKLIDEDKIEKGTKFNILNGILNPIEWTGNEFRYENIMHVSVGCILESEFEPVKETKCESIAKENEQGTLTIRDYLIDQLIESNAHGLKQKLIKELDRKLDDLGKVLSEREEPRRYNFKNIESAKQTYDKIVNLRKIIEKSGFQDFMKLNPEGIIKSLCEIYNFDKTIYENKKVSLESVLFDIGMA